MIKTYLVILALAILIIQTFNYIRIPNFVGRSYNVFHGDPNNKYGHDSGFSKPIFIFTNRSSKRTSDGQYLIPDQLQSSKIQSCSFTPSIEVFKGTLQYKESLKKIVNITVASQKILNGSFYKSQTMKQVFNLFKSKKTKVQMKYTCTTYKLQLNNASLPSFTPQFINSVKQTYHTGRWNKLINQYGTHYVSSVQMGARTIHQLNLNQTIVAKIQNLDVRIPLTLKQFFDHAYNFSTVNFLDYRLNQSYLQRILAQKVQINIGQKLILNTNSSEWYQRISDNQMPIKYNLLEISSLFKYIFDANFNQSDAILKFNQALQSHVDINFINSLTSKVQSPIYIPKFQLPDYYVQGFIDNVVGHEFQAIYNSSTMQLRKLDVYTDNSHIFGVKLYFGNGLFENQTRIIGRNKSSIISWQVPQNQSINRIQISQVGWLHGLAFACNKGSSSPHIGGAWNVITKDLPAGYKIIGFYGRQWYWGQEIDFPDVGLETLRFYYAKSIENIINPI